MTEEERIAALRTLTQKIEEDIKRIRDRLWEYECATQPHGIRSFEAEVAYRADPYSDWKPDPL